MLKQAGLAQLVERAIRNRKVIGSTPIAGSNRFNNSQPPASAVLLIMTECDMLFTRALNRCAQGCISGVHVAPGHG